MSREEKKLEKKERRNDPKAQQHKAKTLEKWICIFLIIIVVGAIILAIKGDFSDLFHLY